MKKQLFVALFRGINVGGNNLIDMKKLKASFIDLGFTQVVTYINSGNVIFESTMEEAELPSHIENMVLKEFYLDLKILVKSFKDIETIGAQLPASWVNDKTMKTNIMFLWKRFDNPDAIKLFKPNAVDNLMYAPGALLWNIIDPNYAQSDMIKTIGTELYKNITVRNANTFRKILQIMQKLQLENHY